MGSWDELKVVLEVARAGSVRKAAGALGFNHSTVSRRMAAYEERLAVRMFERVGTRLVLTPAGAEVMAAAERIEAEIYDVERKIAGGDLILEGTIRVALPPSLLGVFAPEFRHFAREYPDVTLEFVTGLNLVNLSQRDADVALRVVGKPPADLFGRRVGSIAARAFVAPDLFAEFQHRPLREWPWVGWTSRFAHFVSSRWVTEEVGATYCARFESGRDIEDAIRGGLGAGFMLHPDPPGLIPILAAPQFPVPLWMVTHSDLRNVGRIRAFLSVVGDQIRERLSD